MDDRPTNPATLRTLYAALEAAQRAGERERAEWLWWALLCEIRLTFGHDRDVADPAPAGAPDPGASGPGA